MFWLQNHSYRNIASGWRSAVPSSGKSLKMILIFVSVPVWDMLGAKVQANEYCIHGHSDSEEIEKIEHSNGTLL